MFSNPKKLLTSFNDYLGNDGKILPKFRGVLKDILSTALSKVESQQTSGSTLTESKQAKMRRIMVESQRISIELKQLKRDIF